MPFTPIMRRFLQDVFRPSNTLGKRTRDADEDEENTYSALNTRNTPNCLALQNEDVEEDAVVITALNVMPFCCHADLLTMSREQLVSVADTLNAKLPLALHIDSCSTDSVIRSSIEVLVGIRRDVPPAPKAKRSLSMAFSGSGDIINTSSKSFMSSSPVSPLAVRNKTNNAFSERNHTPRLTSLREEEEFVLPDRPQKRRRTLASSPIPTPVQRERMVARSQSHRVASLRPKSSAAQPTSSRVLRSQSQRLPSLKFERTYKNVTVARGRGGVRSQSTILTSTPKTRQQGMARTCGFTPIATGEDMSLGMSSAISTSTVISLELTSGCGTVRGTLDYSVSQSSDDAREVTSGMKDMLRMSTSSASDSDMEITLEQSRC